MRDERSTHHIVLHFPETTSFHHITSHDRFGGCLHIVVIGGHILSWQLTGDILLHELIAQLDEVVMRKNFLRHIRIAVDDNILNGRQSIVRCPQKILTLLHLQQVLRNTQFTAEHFLTLLVECNIVVIFQKYRIAVDFFSRQILDDGASLLGNKGREFIRRRTLDGHHQLRRRMHVTFHTDFRFRRVFAGLQDDDIAEDVGDAIEL